MVLVADDPGGETLCEQVTAACVARVVLSRVDAVEPAKSVREVARRAFDDQVVVGSHQAVRADAQTEPLRETPHQGDEEAPVSVVPKDRDLMHRVRGDVEHAVRQRASRDPRHPPRRYSPRSRTPLGVELPSHFRHAGASLGR